GNAYAPDVDIFDSKEGLVFEMDVPGVRKGSVNVQIDENNIMTVRAESSFVPPEGNLTNGEFEPGNFYRAFTLGEEFDREKIHGSLDKGVLKIMVPRKEAAKPRRIEINA
ncbi:MAG: Hsp20 family protein, partial [Chitinivibrionales bacterium]|nr:Hsp20 family protein [Chitinivibrionales bacterium]MBD3357125.1 Hsp20 family protein [Chitinivibrionales bacterium]